MSGVVGGIGLAFLVGMFAAFAAGARSTGMTLGWINDITGVVTLPIALPGILALHARVRPHAGPASDALLLVGLGAGGTIVVLQVLLVREVLTFEEQIGPVSLAFLVLAAWFVLYGRLAARAGVAPRRHATRADRRELRRVPGMGVPGRPGDRGGPGSGPGACVEARLSHGPRRYTIGPDATPGPGTATRRRAP